MVKMEEIGGKSESFLPWHEDGGRSRPLKSKGPSVKDQVQRSLCLTSRQRTTMIWLRFIHSLYALIQISKGRNDEILVFIFWSRVSGVWDSNWGD